MSRNGSGSYKPFLEKHGKQEVIGFSEYFFLVTAKRMHKDILSKLEDFRGIEAQPAENTNKYAPIQPPRLMSSNIVAADSRDTYRFEVYRLKVRMKMQYSFVLPLETSDKISAQIKIGWIRKRSSHKPLSSRNYTLMEVVSVST